VYVNEPRYLTENKEKFEDTKGVIKRTDNTMAKRKRTIEQTNNDLQNTTKKTKQHEHHQKNPGVN